MSGNRSARIIRARWIIPVRPAGVRLEHHAAVIQDGAITRLMPAAAATTEFPDAPIVDLPEHALIPGLINAHTHAAMTLMRGLADDLPLMRWLKEHIWPAEGRVMSAEFVGDGTLLACAEMLRSGITCFNDMYFFPEAAARAALRARMRAALGMIAIDHPSAYAASADEYLQKGLALRDAMRGESLLSFCLAPHAPYSVGNRTFERIATYANELDAPVHTHVHETLDEISDSVKTHGVRPLQRLKSLGLLGPGFIAVHGVHLEQDEIGMLATHGCHVAHCPASNLKLASGLAPLHDLAQAGINMGLGSDGAASNNRLDLLAEMRLAALLGKHAAADAAAFNAHQVLEMATLGGARALGLDARIGSIEEGKRADLTAIRLDALELAPCGDPVSHVVYAAGREHVSHVWVDGELRVKDGVLLDMDAAELKARATHWRAMLKP
jgi:5-methylthioadenosine/S-adenosylhomocysteine deaminase